MTNPAVNSKFEGKKNLTGLISALIVPFDEKGQVNEAGLRQLIRHNIDNMKVDGLYVGGSTGENFLLETATKKQIFDIAKDEAGERITLIAQIGGPNVYEAMPKSAAPISTKPLNSGSMPPHSVMTPFLR